MKQFRVIICDYKDISTIDIIDETYYKQYHFYNSDDIWYLECLDGTCFKDGTKVKRIEKDYYETVLKECFYTVSLYFYFDVSDSTNKVYCADDLFISNHIKANLYTYDSHLKDTHTFIKNGYIISDFEHIYVNHHKYRLQKLHNNDLIEILGLKIKYNEKFIVINDFMLNNKLPRFDYSNVKYDDYKDEYINIEHRYRNKFKKPSLVYQVELKDYRRDENNGTFIINFFQSFVMSLGMFVIAIINVYIGILNNRSYLELLPLVLMPLIMAISTLVFPVLNRFIQKHKQTQKEKSVKHYNETILKELELSIDKDYTKLKDYYHDFKFNNDILRKMFDEASFYLRSQDDDNYLMMHIGYGNFHSGIKIKLIDGKNYSYNQKRIEEIIDKYKMIKNTEVIIDFKKYKYIVFKANVNKLYDCFESILLQMVTLHHELRLALLIDEDIYESINYLKNINSLFENGKRRIYFNEDEIDMSDDKIYLITLKNLKRDYRDSDIHIIYFTSLNDYPKNSEIIIDISKYKAELIKDGEITEFNYYNHTYNYESIYYRLRKYKIEDNDKYNKKLSLYNYYPRILNLKENYERYKCGIEGLFGIKDDNRPLIYDISEKGIGPHGVISGGTGSGKSVNILSFILSLTSNYPSSKLNITLIDYKGSGLIDSLTYKDELLPHITSYLTNLDQDIFDRSIIALKKECERREELFRKLSILTKSSIMCLDDYHNMYSNDFNLPYLPHHIIIIDEFAELKTDKPEFMKDIISIARIGRSLGIQLILITQKPSGVIDQEIWSNISYRIALKAQNESDSKEMLGNNFAYKINKAGEFYLKKSNGVIDHAYTLNSRAYIDNRNECFVALLNYDLNYKAINYFKTDDKTRQIEDYIRQIIIYHKLNNIKTDSLYLKPLIIKTNSKLLYDYNYKLKEKTFVLGEYDDYTKLKQGLLVHDLNKEPFVLFSYKNIKRREMIIDNVLCSLINNDKNIRIVIISDSHSNKKYSVNGVEYIDYTHIEDIIFLIDILILDNIDILLIVEDYETIIQDDNIKEKIDKIFSNIFQMKLKLIIFIRNFSLLNYKYRDIFIKYQLDYLNKEDSIMMFNYYTLHSEDCAFNYNNQRLIGFKISNNDISIKLRNKQNIIRHIPDLIKPEHNKDYCMLGYNLMTRNKLFINRKLKVIYTSFYEDILDKYKNKMLINKESCIIYRNIKEDKLYDAIVWLGPNINSQYLFITGFKNDLKINEGYLYIRGKPGIKFIYD